MDPAQWQRLKDDFTRLADVPPEDRVADLEDIRLRAPDLHAELVSLLSAHDWRGSGPLGIDDGDAPPEPHRAIGQEFGAYRVVGELGRGGMGVVFLADRADGAFERQVAIKVVGSVFAGPVMSQRLRRERQILAKLNHPHIARLLDGGVTAHGEPYVVMEYVDGIRIDEYCERQQLSPVDRVRLMVDVCRAVAHAHEQRVVHRDLKPSNILVTPSGVPMLLDFGIARLLDDGAMGEQTVTEYRAFTPHFASPEQIRGERQLSPATDVYSLGALLARLVQGRDREAPPRPRLDAALPAGLGDLRLVVARACLDEPARRYETAGDLADDLVRVLEKRPVKARPDSAGYRLARWVDRRRAPLAAAALVVAALAAVAYGTARGLSPRLVTEPVRLAAPVGPPLLDGVRALAVLPLRTTTVGSPGPDRALRLGLADAIATGLSTIPSITVRPMSATVDYLDGARDPVAIGRALKVEAVLDGEVQAAAPPTVRVSLHLIDVASGATRWRGEVVGHRSSLLQGAESLGVTVPDQLSPDAPTRVVAARSAGGTSNLEAQEAYLQGVLAMASSVRQASQILTALDAFERASRLDPSFAQAQVGLALAYSLAGSLTILPPSGTYPKAEQAARLALARVPDLAAAHAVLGDVAADYRWDWPAADASYRRALDLAPRATTIHQTYAEFLARVGRFAEASEHFERAHELDPTRANYIAVRALAYYYEHRFDDAIAEARRGLARDPRLYLAWLYIAVAHAAKGEPAAGLEAARQATALTGGAVPDLFVTACNEAVAGNEAATRALITRLQALGRTRYVDAFHYVAIHAYRGDRDEAFAWLERAYAERSYWMTSLKVHPVVDPLRGDPRLDAMLQRMKLD